MLINCSGSMCCLNLWCCSPAVKHPRWSAVPIAVPPSQLFSLPLSANVEHNTNQMLILLRLSQKFSSVVFLVPPQAHYMKHCRREDKDLTEQLIWIMQQFLYEFLFISMFSLLPSTLAFKNIQLQLIWWCSVTTKKWITPRKELSD